MIFGSIHHVEHVEISGIQKLSGVSEGKECYYQDIIIKSRDNEGIIITLFSDSEDKLIDVSSYQKIEED